jgi:hypothetical protein
MCHYVSAHTSAKSIYVWTGKAWEMEAKIVRPALSGPPRLHWRLETHQHNVALDLVTRAYGVQHMAVPKIWQEIYSDAEKWSCWPLCTKDSLQMRGRCRRASWAAKWIWDWIGIWGMSKGSLTDYCSAPTVPTNIEIPSLVMSEVSKPAVTIPNHVSPWAKHMQGAHFYIELCREQKQD